jgi:hypothetical protein
LLQNLHRAGLNKEIEMTTTTAPTLASSSSAKRNSWLRRLALRATVSTFVLATTVVGLAGVAFAGPEMGC